MCLCAVFRRYVYLKGQKMRYKDIECAVCGKKFDDGSDVVVCPVCGAPHHRACWVASGKCAHEDGHASGYRWEFPITEKKDGETKRAHENEQVFDDIFKNGEGVVICPHCQTPNYGNDMYCRSCHAPLRNGANGTNGAFGGANVFGGDGSAPRDENTEAMYNSYNAYGGLDPDSAVDGIPVREYAAFVGGKAPGRIVRKIATLERYGKTVSPAAGGILGVIWFFRRKMVAVGAVISALIIACCLAAGLLQMTDAYKSMIKESVELTSQLTHGTVSAQEAQKQFLEIQENYLYAERTSGESVREKASEILYVLAFYCVPVIGFICGISFYRVDVRKKIMKTREQCSDMNTYMNELCRRGGTSAGLTLVGVLVYGAAMFLYSYLPMIIVLASE